tara:strand:- start:510 stop:677 length:168 start_codon:yes stop_codon:yes gene_type:complete
MVDQVLMQLVVEVVLVALVVTDFTLVTLVAMVVLVDKLLPHLEILFLHLHPLVVD